MQLLKPLIALHLACWIVDNLVHYSIDVRHGCVIYCSDIRRLGRGAVLRESLNLSKRINCSVEFENEFVSELTNNDRIKGLAVLFDITIHINMPTIIKEKKSQKRTIWFGRL